MLVETAEEALDDDSVKFARVNPFCCCCFAERLVVSALLFNLRSVSLGAGGARVMLAALLVLLLVLALAPGLALSLPSFLLMAMALMLTLFEVVVLFSLLCL